eukprot:scaffold101265_cov18-Tisochrysis_lutea.AAC.2
MDTLDACSTLSHLSTWSKRSAAQDSYDTGSKGCILMTLHSYNTDSKDCISTILHSYDTGSKGLRCTSSRSINVRNQRLALPGLPSFVGHVRFKEASRSKEFGWHLSINTKTGATTIDP